MEKKKGEGGGEEGERGGRSLPGGLLAAGWLWGLFLLSPARVRWATATATEEAQHGKPGEQPRNGVHCYAVLGRRTHSLSSTKL